MTTPFPHQIQGLKRIKKLNYRAICALDMGLGKSFMSLLAVKELDQWPVVVICPAGLKLTWQRECLIHMNWNAVVLNGRTPPTNLTERAKRHRVYIVNYDVLGEIRSKEGNKKAGPGWLAFLKSLNPKLIILDEAQAIRSHLRGGSKRNRWVRQLCQPIPHLLLLTGTPIMSKPADLWPLISLVRPDVFNSWPQFGHAHCGPRMTPWGIRYDGAERLDVLNGRLIDTCLIRKRKEDVLKDLPTVRRLTVPVELSSVKEYQQAEEDFIAWLRKTSPDRARRARKAERLVRFGGLKRLAGLLKLPAVMSWADAFLESGDKLVLFCEQIEIVKRLVERYKQRCVFINGSVSKPDRVRALDRFNKDDRIRLLVGNTEAAGVGLSVSSSADVAMMEFPWLPALVEQAIARVHGIGRGRQGVRSTAWFLVAPDTIDAHMLQLLERKQKICTAVMDGHVGRDEGFNLYDQLEKRLLKERDST